MSEYKIRNAHCIYFEGQTGLCQAKEFVKCNPVNCKLYTIDELSTILDLQEQLKRKEQECEELKKGVLKQCPNCGEKYLNKIGAELYEENERLKQALDEIEKITSKHYISEDDYNKIYNNKWVYAFSKGYATARWELINPILDIINKAKENQ